MLVEASLREHTALMSGKSLLLHLRCILCTSKYWVLLVVLTNLCVAGIMAFNARHHRASRPLHAAAGSSSDQPAEAVAERRFFRRAGRLLPEHSRRQRTAVKQPCLQRLQSTVMQRHDVQPDAHLTALKAQGELDSIAKPVKYSHQQCGASFAAVKTDQPQLRPATDMFGVAAVNSTQGTGMGLVMMRPASSLL